MAVTHRVVDHAAGWENLIAVEQGIRFSDGDVLFEGHVNTIAPTQDQADKAGRIHFRFMLREVGVPDEVVCRPLNDRCDEPPTRRNDQFFSPS